MRRAGKRKMGERDEDRRRKRFREKGAQRYKRMD